MTKWLAAATAAVIAVLVLLWWQIHSPADAAPSSSASPAQPTIVEAGSAATPPRQLAAVGKQVAEATAQAGKIDPNSDAFFYQFDDLAPAKLASNAIGTCYTGGLHRVDRDQMVKLVFKDNILNGEVTITDVRVVEATIHDPELVACMVREVAATHWHDDTLPNWVQDDELVLRPERQKKFHKDNSTTGDEGPDFTNVKR